MKTIILGVIFGLISIFGVSQNTYTVTVNGTVTMQSDGAPVPYYPVIIGTDTLSGNGYYNMVMTDLNGQYNDSFEVSSGESGNIYVSVINGENGITTQEGAYNEENNQFTFDFAISFDTIGGGVGDTCFAMFTYSEGTQPLEIQFMNMSLGEPDQFSWDFGDGTSSTEENPVHLYQEEGIYAVTLNIVNGDCNSGFTMDVFVGGTPWDTTGNCQAMYVAIPSDDNYLEMHFHDESWSMNGEEPDSWSWDFGDGSTSNEQNPVHLYAEEGVYTVCLTIANESSQCESSVCLPVYVEDSEPWNDSCLAFFYYAPIDSTGIDMTHLQFMDGSVGEPVAWHWDFGDGTSSEEQNPSHQFTEEGVYNVCLTIFNDDSTCQDSYCEEVYAINDSSDYNMGFFIYSFDFSNPSTLYFEAVNMSNCEMTYTWSFGDGTTGTGAQISHTYTGGGVYNVTLTAENDDPNCGWSYSSDVWVAGGDSLFSIEGTVYVGEDQPADAGVVYLMTIDTTGTGLYNIDTTQIDQNGHYSFSVNFFQHCIYFTQAELTENSAYYGDYAPTYHLNSVVWEEAMPVIPFMFDGTFDIYMVEQQNLPSGDGHITGNVVFTDKNPFLQGIEILLMDQQNNVLAYSKTDENGHFSFNDLSYGLYKLTAELAGFDANEEAVALSQNNPSHEVSVEITGSEIILGLQNKPMLANSLVSVYPNPVVNKFAVSIDLQKAGTITVSVLNQQGKLMMSESVEGLKGNNTIGLDATLLPQGVYLVKVQSANGQKMNTNKFIKLR